MFSVKPVGIDKLDAEHSLVNAYMHSKSLSRLTLVAVPAFVALDVAYHATALVLKTMRMIVTLQIPAKNRPGRHFFQITKAIAALSYPVIGLVTLTGLSRIHNHLCPQPTGWRSLQIAGLVGIVACVSFAMRRTSAQQRTLDVLKYPVTATSWDWTPYELSLNGLLMPLTAGLTTSVGSGLAIRRSYRKGGVPAAVKTTMGIATVVGLTYLGFTHSERTATNKLASVCAAKGPDHWTCRVDDMAHNAANLRGDPSFIASVVERGTEPDVAELSIAEAVSLSALRQLFGEGRTLALNGVRSLYNRLIHRSDPLPSDSLCQELYAAAVSLVRTTSRMFTRERGPAYAHMWAMMRDMFNYGHLHGPSYVQTAAKYAHMSLSEMVLAVRDSAQRSNVKYNNV